MTLGSVTWQEHDTANDLADDSAPELAPRGYLDRVADAEMAAALDASPAVLIEGPRACGKTWTARRFAASEVLLDAAAASRLAANVDPALLLNGPAPRLLDEWQIAPDIWNPMRRACDDRGRPGQFILTGSADPPDDITRHSGAGRVLRVRMRPMSLFESDESSGSVSLAGLFASQPTRAIDPGLRTDDVGRAACRGGWPSLVRNRANEATALRIVRGLHRGDQPDRHRPSRRHQPRPHERQATAQLTGPQRRVGSQLRHPRSRHRGRHRRPESGEPTHSSHLHGLPCSIDRGRGPACVEARYHFPSAVAKYAEAPPG